MLEGGDRVRLLQIDAPELGGGECYGREAARELARLLGPGDAGTLEADPELDDAIATAACCATSTGDNNVNVELVRRGAAAPFFRRGRARPVRGRSPRGGRRGAPRRCRHVARLRRQLASRPAGRDPSAVGRPSNEGRPGPGNQTIVAANQDLKWAPQKADHGGL